MWAKKWFPTARVVSASRARRVLAWFRTRKLIEASATIRQARKAAERAQREASILEGVVFLILWPTVAELIIRLVVGHWA